MADLNNARRKGKRLGMPGVFEELLEKAKAKVLKKVYPLEK